MADDVGRRYDPHQRPDMGFTAKRARALAKGNVVVRAYAPADRLESFRRALRRSSGDIYQMLYGEMRSDG